MNSRKPENFRDFFMAWKFFSMTIYQRWYHMTLINADATLRNGDSWASMISDLIYASINVDNWFRPETLTKRWRSVDWKQGSLLEHCRWSLNDDHRWKTMTMVIIFRETVDGPLISIVNDFRRKTIMHRLSTPLISINVDKTLQQRCSTLKYSLHLSRSCLAYI